MALHRIVVGGGLPSTRRWSNRIHFTSASPIATVVADFITAFTAAWTTATNPLHTYFPTTTTVDECVGATLAVVSLTHPTPHDILAEGAVSIGSISLAGVSANPALPDQNVILVSTRNALSGRENRGRIHLPAPDQTLVTANKLSSTTAGHISTTMNGLISAMSASGHTYVRATYTLTRIGTPVGATVALTTAKTDEVIRTLRVRSKREKAVYN